MRSHRSSNVSAFVAFIVDTLLPKGHAARIHDVNRIPSRQEAGFRSGDTLEGQFLAPLGIGLPTVLQIGHGVLTDVQFAS